MDDFMRGDPYGGVPIGASKGYGPAWDGPPMGWGSQHPGPMMGGPYGGPPPLSWGGPADRPAMSGGMSMGWQGGDREHRGGNGGGAYEGSYGNRGFKREEQYHGVLVMEMENELAGCIIGKGGSVISSIRRNCGGRLEVREGNRHAGGERVVIIDGNEDEVMRLISEVFDHLARTPSRAWGERHEEDRTIEVMLVMPSVHMGALMGRGGQNMVRIREVGARVRVDSLKDAEERTAVVSGTPEQVQRTLREIAQTLFGEGKAGPGPQASEWRLPDRLPPPPPPGF